MIKKLSFIFVLSFLVSGCGSLVPWTKLEAKRYTEKRYGFSAEYSEGWYRFNAGNFFAITKDGLLLNKIAVERKKFLDKLEFTKRKFEESMTPQELSEVELDNLKSNPLIMTLNVFKNEPATVAGQDAFLIDYEYLTNEGLKMRGTQLGFIHDQWVYRILFEAPSQYYFGTSEPNFKHFLSSFELIGPEDKEEKASSSKP